MIQSSLQRIAAGHPDAVRECIDQYGALVWSLARRLSRTPADAEDATQEIFLAIWTHAARFDASKGSDRTFITMIARRRLIDRIRKTAHVPPMVALEDVEEDSINLVDAPVTTSMEERHIAEAFASLRREHRQVLELSLFNGLSQSEIATRLAMPLGTVKSCMRRGLLALRESTYAADLRQGDFASRTLVAWQGKSSAARARRQTEREPTRGEDQVCQLIGALPVL